MDFCTLDSPHTTRDQVLEAAQQLACLLVETAAVQDYLRLDRAARLDPEVAQTLNEINAIGYDYYGDEEGPSPSQLYRQLEKLPAMRAFRQAEDAVSDLFHSVDQAVSDAAGLAFARNASCCGGT